MIEANKYSDETIHVANWLLLSGEVDVDSAMAEVRKESEAAVMKWDQWNDADVDEQQKILAEEFEERLADNLRYEIENVLSFVDCGYYELTHGFAYGGDEVDYRNTDSGFLIAPMIADALAKVFWPDVAKLVIEHRQAANQATVAHVA